MTDRNPESSPAPGNGHQVFPLHSVDEDGVSRPMATVVVRCAGDAVVVDVRGEIDMITAPGLRKVVEDQISGRPRLVAIQLASVTFLGSSGLGTLVAVLDMATATDVRLRLVAPSQVARRALDLTGLTTRFDVHDQLAEAVS